MRSPSAQIMGDDFDGGTQFVKTRHTRVSDSVYPILYQDCLSQYRVKMTTFGNGKTIGQYSSMP
jgi:hypothetical protein